MTILRRITRRDAATMSVTCLVGRRLTGLDSSAAPGAWVFRFGDGCAVTAEGPWRLIKEGRIGITGSDHQQLFGLKEPVDAGQKALDAIGSAPVLGVSYDDVTGDLRIVFASEVRLEVLTDSRGYESWTLWRPDGTQLVAVGGGEVIPFGPEGAG